MYYKLILIYFFLIGSTFSIQTNQNTSELRNSKLKSDSIEGSGHDKDLETSGSGLNPQESDDEDSHISEKTETISKNNIETDDEDDFNFSQMSGDFNFKKDDEQKSVVKSTETSVVQEIFPKIVTEKPFIYNKDTDLETDQTIKSFDDIANNDLNSYQSNNNKDNANINDNNSNNNNNLSKNGVFIMNTSDDRTTFFAQPGTIAAIIGGTVVGLLCAILVVMFIVYRMRKKDEGSYSLNNEPKRSPALNYSKGINREFFA